MIDENKLIEFLEKKLNKKIDYQCNHVEVSSDIFEYFQGGINILSWVINVIKSQPKVNEWIPFTFDEEGMLDCPLPEVDEEILVSDESGVLGVWIDTWIEYEGYGLDSNIELEGLAWKPLPEPYRK